MDDHPLEQFANARHELHRDHASSRPLSENYERIGLAGELAFARAFHQPLDLERKPAGDGGIDFWIPQMFSIDVKTADKAFNLIVEQGKVSADIYVLAQFHGSINNAQLIGWEWGTTLARAPVRDFGHGILNHYIPRDRLRPMSELKRRLAVVGFYAEPA